MPNKTYSKQNQEAVLLLGRQIKLLRKQKKWSEQSLADRAGISRYTLQKIEKGEMTCAIGSVFELATLVGINLFEQNKIPLSTRLEQANKLITLLPQRIRSEVKDVDDDF
ncbi:XRE family transcriptional regulator [Marinifilum sp. JC120]|nr:XRE family transcriptional regulator [Marinifilum sp. JC120]